MSETNQKFSKREAKTTFKTQIILIYTEVRIYLDSPSKVLKFNRQPSKLLVCYTAVVSVVTQRSSPLVSGEERCVTTLKAAV